MTQNKKDLITLGILGTVTAIPLVFFLCVLMILGFMWLLETFNLEEKS